MGVFLACHMNLAIYSNTNDIQLICHCFFLNLSLINLNQIIIFMSFPFLDGYVYYDDNLVFSLLSIFITIRADCT